MMKYGAGKKSQPTLMVREPSPKFGMPGAMKRLTIDVPAELHANVKAGCARRGVKMSDAIRDLLERNFGDAES